MGQENNAEVVGETSDVGGIADRIGEAIEENAKLSAMNSKPKAEKPSGSTGEGWKKEPKANFETDDAGNIVFDDKTGEPKRRGGRPRKLKKGMELADGSIYKGKSGEKPQPSKPLREPGDAARRSTIIDPDAEPSPQASPSAIPPDDGLGDEAGTILTDLIDDVVRSRAGDEAAMKPHEKHSIGKHAGRMFRHARVPAWFAVLLFCGAYIIRVVTRRKPKGKAEHGPANDARDHHGANAEREKQPRQATNANDVEKGNGVDYPRSPLAF